MVEELVCDKNEVVPVYAWIEKLNERLNTIRTYVRENGLSARAERQIAHDKGPRVREFPVGTMVLLRTPGLSSKLEENWEGPYEVESWPNCVNVRLKIPGRAGKCKVLHINNIKELVQDKMMIHRLVVVAEEHGTDTVVPRFSWTRVGVRKLLDCRPSGLMSLQTSPGTPHSLNTASTQGMPAPSDPSPT